MVSARSQKVADGERKRSLKGKHKVVWVDAPSSARAPTPVTKAGTFGSLLSYVSSMHGDCHAKSHLDPGTTFGTVLHGEAATTPLGGTQCDVEAESG